VPPEVPPDGLECESRPPGSRHLGAGRIAASPGPSQRALDAEPIPAPDPPSAYSLVESRIEKGTHFSATKSGAFWDSDTARSGADATPSKAIATE